MYSINNEERFDNLKKKIYLFMTSVSKNVYC